MPSYFKWNDALAMEWAGFINQKIKEATLNNKHIFIEEELKKWKARKVNTRKTHSWTA